MASFQKTKFGTWKAEVCVKSKRMSRSFPNKARAEVWAKQIEAEMLDKPVNFELGVFSFSDLCDKYIREISPLKKSSRGEVLRLKAFQRHELFKDKDVSEIGKKLIENFVSARSNEIAPGSVLRELTILQALFTQAIKWGLLHENPVKGIENKPAKPEPRKYLVSDKELNTLVKACKYSFGDKPTTMTHRLALLCLFASETAMRSGEMLALKRSDVKGNIATLHTSKTGKGRVVPLSSKAREIIRLLPDDNLFDMTDTTRDALFRKVRGTTSMKWTFHDLRHMAITRLARVPGMDVMTLARITGHSDTAQLMEYFNPNMQAIAKLLD